MKQIRHFIGTAIIVAGLTVGLGLWLEGVIARMPISAAASEQAVHIRALMVQHFWAIAFLFSLIGGFMLYSILVFRQKKGEMEDGDHIEGNTPLEILWTIVPTGVVIYFAFIGGQSLAAVERASADALRVNVNGRQWSWSFEYPELGITSDVLVIPTGRQTLFRLRSIDVIHSFWVPEFGPKQDLLPGGEVRELRINPTKEGEYRLVCAELCGQSHATMQADVMVMSEADFNAWVEQKMAEDPCLVGDQVGCGEKIAKEAGCLACHSLDGTPNIGPTWVGLFGEEHSHNDGQVTVVDAEHIYDSIRNPGSQLVINEDTGEPYENVMPANIGDSLSDEDIAAITAFIESLK